MNEWYENSIKDLRESGERGGMKKYTVSELTRIIKEVIYLFRIIETVEEDVVIALHIGEFILLREDSSPL